jgi:MarR family transcriptional regulator, organic hydroperoxide resistance regulator
MADLSNSEGDIVLNDFLCFGLYASNHAMNRVYQPLLKQLGLTYPQYLVMVMLWTRDDQLVGELGRKLYLESSTLTPMLKRLEALGFITRARDPADERQVRIQLTDKGRSLKTDADCIPPEIIAATGMSIPDLQELITKIESLRSNLADWNENRA